MFQQDFWGMSFIISVMKIVHQVMSLFKITNEIAAPKYKSSIITYIV